MAIKIRPGEIFVGENGQHYRVIDCQENIVSLRRVDGYTLFSCSTRFMAAQFQPLTLKDG